MKRGPEDFALVGGTREFLSDLPVGQLYFPSWERYEAAIRDILERQYYTNHGPLVRELETRLESFLGVRNAVTVTNATLGLYLVALALELKGKVLMPAFTFVATAQAFLLAGVEPVFCEVDPISHHMTPDTAEAALEDGVAAVCAVNLWGGSADVPGLTRWARSQGLPLVFDSAHAFGVERSDGRVGRFGRAEVFSFHATKVMSATEGGCICTDDDDLAERIRNMRSNYGIRRAMSVPLIVQARMSEGQAAVGLASLDQLADRIRNNRQIFDAYRSGLGSLPGVRVVEPANVVHSNYQNVVIEVLEDEYGLSRDSLWSVLRAEGVRARRYFKPGVHRSTPFDALRPQQVDALPVTDDLCQRVLQLPIGATLTATDAERVAGVVRDAQEFADGLRSRV
ncbi:MAG: aminotransferase class I/II-fold pyridoxal phosphate-dependent enzyme [Candidatus Dormibacteria bacterium]|jgi:dTDP-4-amino-4,6-dideoxygalactose transaminase